MRATDLHAWTIYRSVMSEPPLPLAVERKRRADAPGLAHGSAFPPVSAPMPWLALTVVVCAAGVFGLAVYGAFKLVQAAVG